MAVRSLPTGRRPTTNAVHRPSIQQVAPRPFRAGDSPQSVGEERSNSRRVTTPNPENSQPVVRSGLSVLPWGIDDAVSGQAIEMPSRPPFPPRSFRAVEATPPRHSKTEHAARFATTVHDTRQRCPAASWVALRDRRRQARHARPPHRNHRGPQPHPPASRFSRAAHRHPPREQGW